MEKVLMNQGPSCTVEPNTGAAEMPDMRRYVVAKVQGVRSKTRPMRVEYPSFVLG
jgi:ribosome-binding ATPase YchF (GTP1/OBG family)